MTDEGAERIVFFDGVCGLCNQSVDFLLPKDKNNRLHFAALQGKTAERLLSQSERRELNSIVYWKESGTLNRSTAVLTLLKDMGGPWSVLSVFLIVPRPVRDFVYDQVAKYRYRWFGKRETCRMPVPSEQSKFMD